MPTYSVRMTRWCKETRVVVVDASSEVEAEEQALAGVLADDSPDAWTCIDDSEMEVDMVVALDEAVQ